MVQAPAAAAAKRLLRSSRGGRITAHQLQDQLQTCCMTKLLLACHSFSNECRLALLAMLIAFYIVVAVAVAQTTNAGTQHVSPGAAWKCVPHPSWAWWLVRQLDHKLLSVLQAIMVSAVQSMCVTQILSCDL